MKAIVVREGGPPAALVLEDVADPEPAAGQVRVRVEAAGLNFMDIYQRTGQQDLSLPFTTGAEGAGVVDAVGQEVDGLVEGDRVAWRCSRARTPSSPWSQPPGS